MNMRAWFLSLMLLAPALTWAQTSIIVQQSPPGGFQYYPGKALWDDMKGGDALAPQREPSNPHDANTVIFFWNGQRLGYIPRREGSDVERQMDRGAPVNARIVKTTEARNPRQRIALEVYVDL